jgi:hypothetical protein
LNLLPGLHLHHPPETAAYEYTTASARHDQRHRATKPFERRQVEVVEVKMRDENGVNISILCGVNPGSLTPKVPHATSQHRVG